MIPVVLRPRWWAWHLLLVVAVGAMGWLGWWQLQSFEDGRAPVPAGTRTVEVERVTSPGGRLGPGDPGRPVRASGEWDAAGQVSVPDREQEGRPGSIVVTPLRTSSGVLPVVRGWVPEGVTPPPPPEGSVRVRGVLQASETEADASATTVASDGEVAYLATVTLLEKLPYAAEELYDGYLVLRSSDPPDPAAPERAVAGATASGSDGGTGGFGGRWRNLAYAVQWWLFAGAAVFFWAAVLRRAAHDQQDRGRWSGSPESLVAPRQRT